MKPSLAIILALIGMSVAMLASGCQSSPTPTPELTPTENVVVEVVTSTVQPTLAPTETLEATITPLATFTPIGLESSTPTPRATSTRAPVKTAAPSTPKVAMTATPLPPTATSLPDKYTAPNAISPKAGDSNNARSDIQFYFGSAGPLEGNECYLLNVQMVNPSAISGGVAGDSYLDQAHCGDRSPAGKPLKFILYRPSFHNAFTFGTIMTNALGGGWADILKLQWYVRVVQNNGLGPDGVHYSTTPLSPNSATLESDFNP